MSVVEPTGGRSERDLADLSHVIRRRWIVLLACVAVVVSLGIVFLVTRQPTYTATSTFLVDQGGLSVGSSGPVLSERNLDAEVSLMRTDAFASEAARRLGLVAVPPVESLAVVDGGLVELDVRSDDAQLAADTANMYTELFGEMRRERITDTLQRASDALQAPIDGVEERLSVLADDDPLGVALGDELIRLSDRRNEVMLELAMDSSAMTVIRPATAPTAPDGVSPVVLLAAALVGGLLIGVAVAFILEFFDRKIRTPRDVREWTGADVAGSVPRDRGLANGPRLHVDFDSATVDSLRRLRVMLEGRQVLLFTGAESGCGTTTVAAHVAVLFAEAGRRVVMVDAAVAGPRLHTVFAVTGTPGLVEAVSLSSSEVVRPSPVVADQDASGELSLVPCGAVNGRNPEDVLARPELRNVVESLRERFDVVVIDSSALTSSTIAMVLAGMVDSVCLVERSGTKSGRSLRNAWRRLTAVNAPLSGVVLNAVSK